MLKLERINDEVYYNDTKLKINKQASKGQGNEVVYIKDCPEANGQTWISLSRLHEGINEIECKARELTTHNKYELTKDEISRIAELQAEIDAIKAAAKARYVEKPNFKLDVSKLSEEEKQAHIEKVQNYVRYLQNM
jgi:hypothetical protein